MHAAPPPPPPSLVTPVVPVRVEQRFTFDPVRPYEPGARRTISLRAPGGSVLRAPCDGRVVFAGRVGGGPVSVTVRCNGGWRATLGRVVPAATTRAGAPVVRALPLAAATQGGRVTLSVRSPAGVYHDPEPLLAASPAAPAPAPVGAPTGRRPAAPRFLPAQLPDAGLVQRLRHPLAPAARQTTRPPLIARVAVHSAGATVLAALLVWSLRAGRRRAGSLSAAWPATSQRRSSM